MTGGKKRNIILINAFISIVGIIVCCYYYYCLSKLSIPFHSDDAGSTFALMDDKLFGGNSYIHNSYSIFAVLERVCITFWGYTEFATILVFCIQFFIMFFLTACILIDRDDEWGVICCKLVYLIWMCALLGVEGTAEIQISKFHTGPTIVLLLILLVEKEIKEATKRRIAIVILTITAILQMDYVLSVITVIVPLVLFWFKEYAEKKDYRKVIIGLILLCGICAILYIICSIEEIPVELAIYGNRNFSSVQDIMDNISVFFQGLFGMFNCQIVNKKVVAVDFLPKLVKCIVLCVFIGYTVWYLRTSKEKKYITLACIAILTVVTAFIMTGAQGDPISMRYCQCLLFLFPIIGEDILNKLIETAKYQFIIVSLVILSVPELVITNPNTTFYKYGELTEVLQENNISYAVAPYWSSNVVSILSEGNVLVQPCSISSGTLVQSDISTLSLYKDKATMFNTIISGMSKNESWDETIYGMSPENIVEIYGKPLKEVAPDEYHNIYIYDYDIRTTPQKFERTDAGRFYIEGSFFGIYEISLIDIGREIQVIIEGGDIIDRWSEDGFQKIWIQSNKKQNQLIVDIKDMTDEELSTSHVILKTIAEYLPVKIKNKTCTKEEPCVGRKGEEYKSEGIWLVPGTYKLVLYGENLRHIIVGTENEDVQMTAGECGDKRRVYNLYVEKATEVDFELLFASDKLQITNFSIEIDE